MGTLEIFTSVNKWLTRTKRPKDWKLSVHSRTACMRKNAKISRRQMERVSEMSGWWAPHVATSPPAHTTGHSPPPYVPTLRRVWIFTALVGPTELLISRFSPGRIRRTPDGRFQSFSLFFLFPIFLILLQLAVLHALSSQSISGYRLFPPARQA